MNIESATPLTDMSRESLINLLSAYLRPKQRAGINDMGEKDLIEMLEAQGLHADGEYKSIFDPPGEIVEDEIDDGEIVEGE